jgi:BirA family biotin operon repressor/biotin-[acetyl-CoA-carboxylase] ligase
MSSESVKGFGPPWTRAVGRWTLWEYDEVGSTNLVAATLDAWNAVSARSQTAGRGRFHRTWVSDEGGLWLSAVVPSGDRLQQALIPLAAGVALMEALKQYGVSGARLRWPNDVMVGELKLAGLLVDSFHPGRVVVGIGVNVRNEPARQDARLEQIATRLADLLPSPPTVEELAHRVLERIDGVITRLQSDGGCADLSRSINQLWGSPRQVRLDLDGVEVRGEFCGVDSHGRLLLSDAAGALKSFEPHHVRLLREVLS